MNISLFTYRLKSSAANSPVVPSKILGALVALSALFASPDMYAMKRKAGDTTEKAATENEKGKEKESEEKEKEKESEEKETETGEPETKKQRLETPSNQKALTEEKLEALKERADKGDSVAQYQFGADCWNKNDKAQGLIYISKAAGQGQPQAQLVLAHEYASGKNYEKDMQKAFSLFRKAADQGVAEAQYYLARLYLRDEATERNARKALDLLAKSASEGFAPAQRARAHCLMNEESIAIYRPKTSLAHSIAFQLYVFAAAEGEKDAQKALGLERSDGTESAPPPTSNHPKRSY